MLAKSLGSVIRKNTVFRYRLSGGEHPVAQRKQVDAALDKYWGDGRARFFNPPLELLGMTLRKIKNEGARGVVVVPFWMKTAATASLRRMKDAKTTLKPTAGRFLVAETRGGTESCPLLLAKAGLRDAPRARRAELAVDADMTQ